MTELPEHYEARVTIAGSPDDIFALADEPDLFMRHMSQPSLMMGGGALRCDVDALGGKAVGSVIRFKGTAFGLNIDAKEVIEERMPPTRKVWATIETPRLIVIRDYRIGFEITSVPVGSELRVWIDYALPAGGVHRLLGSLFGRIFARWCVGNMARAVQGQRELAR